MLEKQALVLCCLAILLPSVLSQGYGCDDNWLPDDEREDCWPEPEESNEEDCRARDCTWCPTRPDGPPWCYIPKFESAGAYLMIGEPVAIDNGYRVNLVRAPESPRRRLYDGEEEFLTLQADFESNSRLRIRIVPTRANHSRWEVPMVIRPPSETNTNLQYAVTFANDPVFSFNVTRRSTGAVLMQAGGSLGPFIYAEQYLSLAWRPPTENVYGIGENEQPTFKHDFSRSITWALWARDQTPGFTDNIYGVQPYYTVLENDGSAHSVAILNSNAQQFSMVQGPLIKYITIGGVLDFYFFLGPTPENTVQQYTEAVGRAQMPPYWALGFQLCRFGYNTIANMKAAVDRTAMYDIPHDVQYGDIDIMDRRLDFTYSERDFPGLPAYIRELKTKGIKFVTILDPCISLAETNYRPYELGNTMDVWMKRADGTPGVGRVWPDDPCHFPDYSKPSTREWWITLIKEFHDLLEYDGLWIDMNEPANFVTGDVNGCAPNKWNNPPYTPSISGGMTTFTVCMDNVEFAGRHYDTHSMYGWHQSEPTLVGTREGTGKRALVLSRSTFLGSGHWAAHWLGDNFSLWSNLHFSIIGMLQYNQFGVPFAGSDICGFNRDAEPEMCQRWMELGAFYPFSRNHNAIGHRDQDPGAFGEAIATSSRNALLVRYTLLPYFYTLFYQATTEGGTVVRALWHEFARDTNTYDVDKQFLWGSGLLISPVLEPGAVTVNAYFPNSRFYSYYTGAEVATKGDWLVVPAPLDFIPVHVHGGNILPTQEPAVNTDISRNNPFGLIVALDGNLITAQATGKLYYDDGDVIDPVENGLYFEADFRVVSRRLTSEIVYNGYTGMVGKVLNTVRLLGAGAVTAVTVNGAAHTNFTTLPSGEVLISGLNLPIQTAFAITY